MGSRGVAECCQVGSDRSPAVGPLAPLQAATALGGGAINCIVVQLDDDGAPHVSSEGPAAPCCHDAGVGDKTIRGSGSSLLRTLLSRKQQPADADAGGEGLAGAAAAAATSGVVMDGSAVARRAVARRGGTR